MVDFQGILRIIRCAETGFIPGSGAWGFFVIRTTYSDQKLWERYLKYIRKVAEHTLDQLNSPDDAEKLKRHFQLCPFESADLDGMSPEQLQDRFLDWRSNIPPAGYPDGLPPDSLLKTPSDISAEVPPSSARDFDHARFHYFVFVDDAVLRMFQASVPEPGGDSQAEETEPKWLDDVRVAVMYADNKYNGPKLLPGTNEPDPDDSDDPEDDDYFMKWQYVHAFSLTSFYELLQEGDWRWFRYFSGEGIWDHFP